MQADLEDTKRGLDALNRALSSQSQVLPARVLCSCCAEDIQAQTGVCMCRGTAQLRCQGPIMQWMRPAATLTP